VNYDEMDGDRLRLTANRNCYRLSRVSWALLKLLVNYSLVFVAEWHITMPVFCHCIKNHY